MKTYISFTLILVAIFFLNENIAFGQNFAAPYLQFSTSAVGSAFGDAYTSLAEDASATYWNPAGLAAVKNFSFVGLVSSGLGLDRNFNAASVALDMKRFGVIALSYCHSGVTDIQGYNENDVKTNSFNVVNMVPGFSYALRATTDFSVGATLHYIRQDLNVQIDNGYSVDAGLRYEIDISGKQIIPSVVVQNLFGKVGVNQLPQVLRIGAGLDYGGIMKIGTFKGEIDYVIEDMTNSASRKYFNFGVSYGVRIRGIIMVAQTGFQNGQNFAAGTGLGMSMGKMMFRVDYAYVIAQNQIFNNNHRIGITISGQ
jgi:hypothetical protein